MVLVKHAIKGEDGMSRSARTSGILCAALLCTVWSGAAIGADPAACESYQAAITGGPTPSADSDTVVIRWLANANYEFAYKGKVYLFDAYFDRVSRNRDLGFKTAQVTKAEAIFVSHAHFDHISDIGPVARQTGAPVVGSPITAATAIKLGAPEIRRRDGRSRAGSALHDSAGSSRSL